jgi:hypothetical protein
MGRGGGLLSRRARSLPQEVRLLLRDPGAHIAANRRETMADWESKADASAAADAPAPAPVRKRE